jgi:nucleoside-diphosphate-sugar epimerase
MSRVLVTGAGGFIGQRVQPLLAEAGHEVIPASGDLLEPATAGELIADSRPTQLLHLAWYTEHGSFWESPENLLWVEASLRLYRAFVEGGGERFVGVGSCAEYEWSQPVLSESDSALRPASLYGICKDATRRALEGVAERDGTSFAWGRLFFTYGPEEASGRLVPAVAEALAQGRPARTSDGEQIRDYLHVDDAAAALVALLASDARGPVNIGTGEGVRVRQIVEELGRLAGRPELIELGAVPRTPGDPAEIIADATRLRSEIGWSPRVSLEDGLASTLAAASA